MGTGDRRDRVEKFTAKLGEDTVKFKQSQLQLRVLNRSLMSKVCGAAVGFMVHGGYLLYPGWMPKTQDYCFVFYRPLCPLYIQNRERSITCQGTMGYSSVLIRTDTTCPTIMLCECTKPRHTSVEGNQSQPVLFTLRPPRMLTRRAMICPMVFLPTKQYANKGGIPGGELLLWREFAKDWELLVLVQLLWC